MQYIIASNNMRACDCGCLGGFVFSNQAADIVFYGRVIHYVLKESQDLRRNLYSINFLIIEKLLCIEKNDTIHILGDYGFECRPNIQHFKSNTE